MLSLREKINEMVKRTVFMYWSSQIALNFEFLSVYYLVVNVGQYIVATVKVKS